MDRYHLKVCESTNDTARFFLESGVKVPFVVTAEVQTRGRGQRTRKWASEKGGLYSSFALEKMHSRKALILGAHSAYYVLVKYLPVKVRFPNDLMVANRKIGGVLVEQTNSATIIGIGINVNQREFPEELHGNATSLFLEKGMEFDIMEITNHLVNAVERLKRVGYESLFEEYVKTVFRDGECVIHLKNGREISCVIEKVDKEFNVYTTSGNFLFDDIIWIEWL